MSGILCHPPDIVVIIVLNLLFGRQSCVHGELLGGQCRGSGLVELLPSEVLIGQTVPPPEVGVPASGGGQVGHAVEPPLPLKRLVTARVAQLGVAVSPSEDG